MTNRLSQLQGDNDDGTAPLNELPISQLIEAQNVADYQEPVDRDLEPVGPLSEDNAMDTYDTPTQERSLAQPPPSAAVNIAPSAPPTQMPPPIRPTVSSSIFGKDESTALPHTRLSQGLSDTEFAMAIWCEVSGVSRLEYSSLRQIHIQTRPETELHALPGTLDTLKQHLRSSLPLLELRRKNVPLDPEQQPTLPESIKTSGHAVPEDLYFFNPTSLFRMFLQSDEMRSKMHVGLGHFVDAPSEPWHSDAWLSSIRTTSGQFALYPPPPPTESFTAGTTTRRAALAADVAARAGQSIFPSDFVQYQCNRSDCYCAEDELHIGRVIAVGLDHQSTRDHSGPPGSCALRIQRIVSQQELPDQVCARLDPPAHPKELFLMEADILTVLPDAVQPFMSTYQLSLHYRYGTRTELNPTPLPLDINTCRYFIRRVYNPGLNQRHRLRPRVLQTHLIRGQLEIQTYGRDALIRKLTSHSSTISLPLFTFIDGFGLYRNMYRSLMGYYFIHASLDTTERNRQANVFPLTLRPHGANLADVVEAIGPSLSLFEEGMTVSINGEEVLVFAFTFAYIGDMPQQQKNSGMLSQRANFGCRFCFTTKADRGDLEYDTISNGRYHYQTVEMQSHMSSLASETQRSTYSRNTGIDTPEVAPLTRISPALDVLLSRPADPAHSEFNGITHLAHQLLKDSILTLIARNEYCEMLKTFPFPPTWAHLQNPKRHLASYRLSEHGRWSIIAPILLRVWLKDSHI